MSGVGDVGSRAKGELNRWIDIAATPPQEARLSSLLSPRFMAGLQGIDDQQSWVEVAAAPLIKDYPVEDITEAYNNIIRVSPHMRAPEMRPALVAMVRRQLSQNQLMDTAEIVELSGLEKVRTDIARKRQEIEISRRASATDVAGPSEGMILDKLLSGGQAPAAAGAARPGLMDAVGRALAKDDTVQAGVVKAKQEEALKKRLTQLGLKEPEPTPREAALQDLARQKLKQVHSVSAQAQITGLYTLMQSGTPAEKNWAFARIKFLGGEGPDPGARP